MGASSNHDWFETSLETGITCLVHGYGEGEAIQNDFVIHNKPPKKFASWLTHCPMKLTIIWRSHWKAVHFYVIKSFDH
jgi:hypothetical protein